MRYMVMKISVVLLLGFILTGCGANKSLFGGFGKVPEPQETAEVLVQQGLDKFRYKKYQTALEIFEKVKSRYPFSDMSLLAELKFADSHFYMDNFEEARVLYEEFEERHPTNEAIPYVLFQVGMCYFSKIDTIDRDTSGASSAVLAFNRLLHSYPDSPYTDEAGTRIQEAKNFLSRHEYYVANYYLRTGSLLEGEARLEFILATYPMADVASKSAKVLADLKAGNPPQKPWYSWVPGWTLISSRRDS